MVYEYGETWWNDEVKPKELEEEPIPVSLHPPHPTWTDRGTNLGLCDESPSSNRLSHDITSSWHYYTLRFYVSHFDNVFVVLA
jgi:hypothetical protein